MSKRPPIARAVLTLVAFQAVSGIAGGIGLVRDPVANIGMPVSLLAGTPFRDYLVPGLILLVVLGIFPLFVLYGLLRRRSWAWWLALAAGLALLIWITTEAALLGYLPGAGIGLQIAYGFVGAAILGLTLTAPARRYFLGRSALNLTAKETANSQGG